MVTLLISWKHRKHRNSVCSVDCSCCCCNGHRRSRAVKTWRWRVVATFFTDLISASWACQTNKHGRWRRRRCLASKRGVPLIRIQTWGPTDLPMLLFFQLWDLWFEAKVDEDVHWAWLSLSLSVCLHPVHDLCAIFLSDSLTLVMVLRWVSLQHLSLPSLLDNAPAISVLG